MDMLLFSSAICYKLRASVKHEMAKLLKLLKNNTNFLLPIFLPTIQTFSTPELFSFAQLYDSKVLRMRLLSHSSRDVCTQAYHTQKIAVL